MFSLLLWGFKILRVKIRTLRHWKLYWNLWIAKHCHKLTSYYICIGKFWKMFSFGIVLLFVACLQHLQILCLVQISRTPNLGQFPEVKVYYPIYQQKIRISLKLKFLVQGDQVYSVMKSDGNRFLTSWTALTRHLGMKTTF